LEYEYQESIHLVSYDDANIRRCRRNIRMLMKFNSQHNNAVYQSARRNALHKKHFVGIFALNQSFLNNISKYIQWIVLSEWLQSSDDNESMLTTKHYEEQYYFPQKHEWKDNCDDVFLSVRHWIEDNRTDMTHSVINIFWNGDVSDKCQLTIENLKPSRHEQRM
jgi:hypothetical protein